MDIFVDVCEFLNFSFSASWAEDEELKGEFFIVFCKQLNHVDEGIESFFAF